MLHVGGLGDLVLFSSTIAAIRLARPSIRIVLAVRSSVAPLVACSPISVDRVVPLEINPYLWAAPSQALFEAIESVLRAFEGERVDTLVSAELRPTWLTWVLSAFLRVERAVSLRGVPISRALLRSIYERFGLSNRRLERYQDARKLVHETQRYERLLAHLDISPVPFVRWTSSREVADRVLPELALEPKDFLVCFPFGSSTTRFKRWPRERYIAVLGEHRAQSTLQVVLTGDESERAELEEFAADCALKGLNARVFAGTNATFPELCALLANAQAYLGNDTGLAHLAAALGTPGVTVFGGGHWPRYAPWANATVGLVHPLPCFGCQWDCAFGHGVCVEAIGVAPVAEALGRLEPGDEPPRVVELATLPQQTLALLKDASATYRRAQADRAARFEAVVALQERLAARAPSDGSLQHEADARLAALLEATQAARTYETEMISLNAALASGQRALTELSARAEVAEARQRQLEKVCDERLAVIEEQTRFMQHIQAAADERLSALREKDEAMSALRAEVVAARAEGDGRLATLEATVAQLRAELEWRSAMLAEAMALAQEQKDELTRLRSRLASSR